MYSLVVFHRLLLLLVAYSLFLTNKRVERVEMIVLDIGSN